MAAATGVNTVWIGFMDIVPVIGTVKEAVELVLALYEGNKEVMKEKEKAVEDFLKESFEKWTYRGDEEVMKEKENITEDNLKESFKKHVKLRDSDVDYFRSNGSRDAAAAASEYSGLKNVKEVEIGMIIEYMGKVYKTGAKGPPAKTEQEKKQNEKVEQIKKEMLEKIRLISPNFKFSKDLTAQLKRSKRGEHVFNNNILKFHSDVLKEFKKCCGIDELSNKMDEFNGHTLDTNTAMEIQDNMVADFAADEFYLNVNADIYGECCKVLREALLAVMKDFNPDDESDKKRNRVELVIDTMNNHEFYVDQLAKEKWIKQGKDEQNKKDKKDKKDEQNKKDRQSRFTTVKGKVVNMYRTERGLSWCDAIQRKVTT